MSTAIILKVIITIGLCLLLFIPIFEKYNTSHNRIYQTCQFVQDKIVPIGVDRLEWLRGCRVKSHQVMRQTNDFQTQLNKGNEILSELQISHLELFNQKKNDAIWTDTDTENGIEAQFIDGQLVITRVYPGSDAQKKGLQRGDRVILGPNESMGPYELNHWNGELKIERRNSVQKVKLEPKTLNIQRQVTVSEIEGIKILAVESFKSQYFEAQVLESVFASIRPKDKVIVDLRGNNGGNFVSGLRLLSPFFCHPTTVGFMKKKTDLGDVGYFEDNLDDTYQIETLNRHESVALRTFQRSHCLPKPLMVLVNAQSRSTAEWVALAFREFFKTPIHGAGSAGELLVAIWYDISHIWGDVVKISIPEAFYESKEGQLIEGHGVVVDGNIYSSRADFERGFDSEVWQAVQLVKRLE